MESVLWFFVLLTQREINLHWLDSSELDVIWPAILDPPFEFYHFLKNSRNNSISAIWWTKLKKKKKKKRKEKKNYRIISKSWSWPDLHDIWWLSWQRQKWWTRNRHIIISAGNEGTATISVSPLVKIVFSNFAGRGGFQLWDRFDKLNKKKQPCNCE